MFTAAHIAVKDGKCLVGESSDVAIPMLMKFLLPQADHPESDKNGILISVDFLSL